MTGIDPSGEAHDSAQPTHRLSWPRLVLVLAVLAVATWFVVGWVTDQRTDDAPLGSSASVPYVDVTLTPTYPFQDPQSNPARAVALAFVVADPAEPCRPSWGGYYTLDEADSQLELSRRLAQLRSAGGDAMVSFGGQANDELGLACSDPDALADAYRDVIERYRPSAIDLDIEGDELLDRPASARRAAALASVQAERADEPIAIWLTLPIAPSGFTADGLAEIDTLLGAGVELTGVNAMTMNYGADPQGEVDMAATVRGSLEQAVVQLGAAYEAHGVTLTEGEAWARLGATPMIGQNDVATEVFDLDDATALADLAAQRGLGRVSLWSLNRDVACDSAFADVAVLSNTCSGVAQERLEFTRLFSSLTTTQQPTLVTAAPQPASDDPTASPYPVWRPEAHYPEGYKVVRRGRVYQAQWYTNGTDPTAITGDAWSNPWTLLGPVDPDDEPFVPATVPPGTAPDWSPTVLYSTGDRVLFNGLPYQARWTNQADTPQTLFPVDPDSAWSPQFVIAGEP